MKVFIGLLLFCLSTSFVMALSPQQVRAWLEDLTFYEEELSKRHIDLFHTLDPKDFKRELDALKAELPELHEWEVIIKLMTLNRKIGDGHSAIPLWERSYHRFPLEVAVFDDQVLVIGATDAYQRLLGAELSAVNNKPMKSIIQKFADVVPFVENPYSERVRVARYLLTAELLHGFGVIADPKSAAFTFQIKGKQETLTLTPLGSEAGQQVTRLSYQNFDGVDRLFDAGKYLWCGALHEGQTLYIYYQRYPSMSAMDAFAGKVLDYLKKHKTRNLIIDFRENYGGNYFVGLKLAEYLVLADAINWRSGVYVLTSNKTFSAAMSNSAQFRQLLNARLVGQPTGARPVGYQDGDSFKLPHSKLLVMYSKRRYRFQDTEAPALTPDIPIPLQPADFVEGRDPVMAWVLKDINTRSQ